MAETENDPPVEVGDDDDALETPGYKPPAQKTLEEIQNTDADDESLVRYKQQLLGELPASSDDPDPRNVVVEKMIFQSEGRDPITLDLTDDKTLDKLKDTPITIKEGCEYRLEIVFKVKKEIVAGLRLFQATFRKGIKVDKSSLMVGSYGPKAEPHIFKTPKDDAPKGMISRGHYTVKSKFTDDDKNVYLEWEWSFDIKKDWD